MGLRVCLAGHVRVESDAGASDAVGLGRLGRVALAYLVVHRHRPVPRVELADVLWNEELPRSFDQLVRGLASKIRAVLQEAGLDPTQTLTTAVGTYQLRLPADAVVDVEEASAAVSAARAALGDGDASSAAAAAAHAAAIAARQFLPWASGSWVEGHQAELRQVHLEALELRARAAICHSQWSMAITAAEEAIVLEPFRESAYVSLMAAHAGAGRRGEALRAYERCRHLLAEDLGVRPSAPTEAAYVELLGEEPTSQPASPAALPLPLPTALARLPGSFIVGRDAEAEVLATALKRVDAEGRQSVLVTGEPGVGKTALVAELARNAHSQGARVLYGRCDEDLAVAYQPFAQALGHWVEHGAAAELESHVDRCGGVLARLVPALNRRLPGVVAPPVTDAEADRSMLFEAVTDALVTASASAPVVMVLEDLHWASAPTLLLLRQLVSGVEAARALVVGTWRHSEVDASHPLAATLADLRRHPGVGRLRLEGLDEAGVAAFVEAAGPGGDDTPGLAVDLHAHTAGNPFFVGELLRHLGEMVPDAPKRWLHDARAGVVEAPEGVVEVVGRRLSRLSPLCNRTLVLASVVGAEFDLAVVEAATDATDADATLDGIEEAVRARLVVESASPGRYSFAHALVRQSLYGSLGRTRRARLHRRVGEAIESLPGDDRLRLPALAHHFIEAAPSGCGAKAADYAIAAARSAIDSGGDDGAAALVARALTALDSVQPPDLARRCDLYFTLALIHTYRMELCDIRDASLMAAEAARLLGSPERLASAAASVSPVIWPSDYELEASLLREALAIVGDEAPGLTASLMSCLSVNGTLSDEESKALSDHALVLARSTADVHVVGPVLWRRCLVLFGSPESGELLEAADELVQCTPPGAWMDGWRHASRMRAIARLVTGDRPGFDADLDGAERQARERNDQIVLGMLGLWRANQALLDGRFEDVEAHAARHRGVWNDSPSHGAGYLLQLAALRHEQGRIAEMVPALAGVIAGAHASGEDRRLGATGLSHAFLSFAHLSCKDAATAGQHYREAARIDVRQWQRPLLLSYVAELSIALRDTAAAPGLYEHLLPNRNQILASGIAPCCPGAVDRYLGILAMVMRRWKEAETHFRVALDMESGLQAPPLVARTQHWYGRMLLERNTPGDREQARKLLSMALETATRLGQLTLASDTSRYLEPVSARS